VKGYVTPRGKGGECKTGGYGAACAVCNVKLRSNIFAFSLVSTQTVFQNDGGHVEVMSRGRLSHWHLFFFPLSSPPLSSSYRPNTQQRLSYYPRIVFFFFFAKCLRRSRRASSAFRVSSSTSGNSIQAWSFALKRLQRL
jgi:hypothetical protein